MICFWHHLCKLLLCPCCSQCNRTLHFTVFEHQPCSNYGELQMLRKCIMHLYIAQIFSQFKENMEINQGIQDGPNKTKKIIKEKLKKDWTENPH